MGSKRLTPARVGKMASKRFVVVVIGGSKPKAKTTFILNSGLIVPEYGKGMKQLIELTQSGLVQRHTCIGV